MRSVSVFGAFALLFLPGIAAAAPSGSGAAVKGNSQGPARSSSQYSLRREEAGGPDAQIARTRARAGDCAGALTAYDAAIRNTIEPTLRRDRGLCHEKLGNPFPAMDDFRAYLTARPEAPDADQIRQRLAQLEEQTGGGAAAAGNDASGEEAPAEGELQTSGTTSSGGGHARAAVSGSASVSASASGKPGDRAPSDAPRTVIGPKPGEAERSYDYYRAQEKQVDEANASPLRLGTGAVIGAFVHVPRFFVGEGEKGDLSYAVGATLRWATSRTLSLVGELGFAGTGTQGENTARSGPLAFGGVELRFPMHKLAADQLLVRGGLGWERYTVSGTRQATSYVLGRAGVGFRHVFGPAVAFELLAEAGPGYALPDADNESNRVVGVVGGSFALVIGF